ncbi:hypothetical protein UVI_02012420 [Ustilaginoidea virens]|uniref:Uncharacterized protein n=1 Tax=Ustilaginoidea virens TaxID=1159556 RepID=A0A1B5L4Y5_USTVR|nr:hypothetical protein UVI_02012420 [Ustilaginoidea virens]
MRFGSVLVFAAALAVQARKSHDAHNCCRRNFDGTWSYDESLTKDTCANYYKDTASDNITQFLDK